MRYDRLLVVVKKSIYIFLLGLTFCFAAVFGFLALTSGEIASQAVKKNLALLEEFERAANFVETFVHEFQRLPNKSELVNGLQKNSLNSQILLNESTTALPNALGKPIEGSFYLSYWRGEWEEFYLSSNKQHTLILEKEKFYPFGSAALTNLLSFISIVGFLVLVFLRNKIFF